MSSLAIPPQPQAFTPDQVELIKKTVAVGATDDELQLFMYVAKKTGLDPFTRQIYAIKRQGKMGIQTGIDGYRVVADRTGLLAGISDPSHTEAENAKYPLTATVTVKKLLPNGAVADFTATARWSEYNAGGPMWAKMPYLMLGKCAEALALRKAFPADLSGVYTTEEMAQADNDKQRDEVFAEVDRQKASRDPVPTAAEVFKIGGLPASSNDEGGSGGHVTAIPAKPPAPPELEWSYVEKTGVLICRLIESAKGAKGVKLQFNGTIKGTNVAYYWHKTHQDALIAAKGKIAKVIIDASGKQLSVTDVLEIDGVRVEKPAAKDGDAETKARLLASNMGMSEADLLATHKDYCKGSWLMTIGVLESEQARRENPEPPEAA
jgi:phage recombination protein Bet